MKRQPTKAVLMILQKEGITQRDLANNIGVKEKNISKWKKGCEPNLEHTVKLCKRYPYVKKFMGLE